MGHWRHPEEEPKEAAYGWIILLTAIGVVGLIFFLAFSRII